MLSSTVLALLLAEGLTRLVGRIYGVDYSLYRAELTNPERLPEGLFSWDELRGVRLTAGAHVLATTSDFSVPYIISSQGLRDREYDVAKPGDRVRILALGDSLTFGEGVPYGERFTDVAEEAFDNLEILNAGVPGYGVDQALIYLASEGVNYQPDFVFLFLHAVMARRHSTRIIRDGEVVLPRRMETPRVGAQYVPRTAEEPPGWLRSHSALYSWLSYRWTVERLRERFEEADRRLWLRISRDAGDSMSELTASTADWERLFQRRTELLLREVVELGREHGFAPVVVGIGEYKAVDYVRSLEPSLTYHSLTGDLSAASERRNIRFTYDLHYNPETHGMLGEALVDIICEGTPSLICDGRRVSMTQSETPEPVLPPDAATEVEPLAQQVAEVRPVVAATFVRRVHRGFLFREPSAGELANWKRRIEEDASARVDLVAWILESQEYHDAWRDQLFIISMYLGVFNRRPDSEGYAAYLTSMEEGDSPEQLVRGLVTSDEWSKRYRRLDDAGVTIKLWRQMLRREPTAVELETWTERLASGGVGARIALILSLYDSPEQWERNAADLLPCQLSLGLTAALPQEQEYEYWAGRLRLGEAVRAVIHDYLAYH
jgi:hypothetical protein